MVSRKEYREDAGIVIELVGTSGVEYHIKIKIKENRMVALNRIIPELIKNGVDMANIVNDFCGRIINWDVYAYDSDSQSWDRICIDPLELVDPNHGGNKMPHKMDQVASLLLALNDDLNVAKSELKMFTLRRYLLKNWPLIWLINSAHDIIGYNEFRENMAELEITERGEE
jgi:hypothetical protein